MPADDYYGVNEVNGLPLDLPGAAGNMGATSAPYQWGGQVEIGQPLPQYNPGPQVQVNPSAGYSGPVTYGANPNPGYVAPRANSSPQRPNNFFLRQGSNVLGRTPVGGALNFTQALARGRVMTDTPIGRLLQSVGHLFGGTLGRHQPVSIDPWSGTVSGGREGHTGQQYGVDPYTGRPVMNADPASGGGGYVASQAGGGDYGGGETGGGGGAGAPSWAGTGQYGVGALQGFAGGRINQFLLNRLT